MVASKLDEIDTIKPADTWSQPSSFLCTEPIDDKTVAVELSNFEIANTRKDASDSLRKLISLSTKLNSEMLKETLNNRILPTVKTFDFQITNATNDTVITLNETRSILRCIGPYISDLGIYFRMDKYPKNIDRYFFKMRQYIGPNLKTVRLKFFPTYQDWFEQLKPLLSKIECLVLETSNYDFDYDIDFQLYCPNLKILKMSMNLNGTLLSKEQPKLERISMLNNQFMEERLVLEFMKNNSQLLYLKIEANDCNNLLNQIPIHLPMLEKLCLYQGYPNISADNLGELWFFRSKNKSYNFSFVLFFIAEHLTVMKNLTKLKLMYLEPDDLNGILSCLSKFKELQELKIHLFYDGVDSVDLDDIYSPNLDLIVTLAQELPQLECFHIRYCNIDADTLNNFVRYARKLKYLAVYRCGCEITDGILENIENIRQTVNPTMMVLYADKIYPELNKEVRYRCIFVSLPRKYSISK